MKLRTEEDHAPVITNNTNTKKAYRINASPKAFAILSSNIYSNKIRAIIREISSNAVDAHVAANSKERFDVKLPTYLEPVFVVRDYGIGLSHEDVEELYSTYFESTKTNSNLFVGALGLGSKSPFSYTSTFTVISYFNGMARTYSVYIDGDIPTTQLVSEVKTTERNGLEVSVPVKQADVYKWQVEAKYVYSTFSNILPNLVRKPDDEYAIEYISIPEGGHTMVPGKGIAFVMGGVRYPLNEDSCPIPSDAHTLRKLNEREYLSKQCMLIEIPIGFADIEPGREGLSYDETTSKNIKELLVKVSDELAVEYVNRLVMAKNGRELTKAYKTMPNVLGRNVLQEERMLFGKKTSIQDILKQHIWSNNKYFDDAKIESGMHGIYNSDARENSEYDTIYPVFKGKKCIDYDEILGLSSKVLVIQEVTTKPTTRTRLNLIKAVRNKLKAENKPVDYTSIIIYNPLISSRFVFDEIAKTLETDLEIISFNTPTEVNDIIEKYYNPLTDSVNTKKASSRSSVQRSALQVDCYEFTVGSTEVARVGCTSYDLNTQETIDQLISWSRDPNYYFTGYYYYNDIPLEKWDERVNIRIEVPDFSVEYTQLSKLGIKVPGNDGDVTKINVVRITSKMINAVKRALSLGHIKELRCYYKDYILPLYSERMMTLPEDSRVIPSGRFRSINSVIDIYKEMHKHYKKFGRIQDSGQVGMFTNSWDYRRIYEPCWDIDSVERDILEHAITVEMNSESTNVKFDIVVDYWKLVTPTAYDITKNKAKAEKISKIYDGIVDCYPMGVGLRFLLVDHQELDMAINHYNTYNAISNNYNHRNDALSELRGKINEMTPEDYSALYSIRGYIKNSMGLIEKDDIDGLYQWARQTMDRLIKTYS